MQITDQMFNDWVRQHQRLLFGIAYWWTGSRTDAEELTQEAFLQAHRSRSSLIGVARSTRGLPPICPCARGTRAMSTMARVSQIAPQELLTVTVP